jgi:hypothetical protein
MTRRAKPFTRFVSAVDEVNDHSGHVRYHGVQRLAEAFYADSSCASAANPASSSGLPLTMTFLRAIPCQTVVSTKADVPCVGRTSAA